MTLINKAKSLLSDISVYWNTPLKGRYMPFKEIGAYSFGGIGIYCIKYMATTLMISGTNVVLSNATGIPPAHLLIIYYISVLAGIPLTALKAHLIDNLRLKPGKYRPWILGMGIPSVILCLAIVFTPYHDMPKSAAYLFATLYSLGLNFVYYFFEEAYENLIFLLSPNTQERADVTSIKSITYSFAPTVLNPLLPLMVKILNTGDVYDVRIYQALFPIVSILGIGLSIIVYANTKEKIVQASTHVEQIGFLDAIKAVAKNKYFWITSLATWIGFLETAQKDIMLWLYNYGGLCTDAQYSIITIVYGNASLWGMLAAPFCIRRWGKKAVLIVTNMFNILFIALMYPSVGVRSIWLVLICLWVNAVMGSFAHILTPAVNADIRDYQQYITGERIDGMFSAVALITNFVTMATNTVLPLIYQNYGISSNNGFANPYDILKYDENSLYSLINLLIILSVIGAALNVVPYFFYDLSEVKQRAMVSILKIRAMFEDFGNNALKNKALVDGVEILHTAMENCNREHVPADKKGNKKAYRAALKENELIDISKMVMAEYNKFSSAEFKFKVAHAAETVNGGIDAILSADSSMLSNAKAMPKNTHEEKTIRKYCIAYAKQMVNSKKIVIRDYNSTMPEFDFNVFDALFAKETANEEAKKTAYAKLDEAKKSGSKELVAEIKAELKVLSNESYAIKGEIKQARREYRKYTKAIKPYAQAQKLLQQKEDFEKFAEIEALYDDAAAAVAEEERLAKEQAERETLEKKFDKERRLAEKKVKKNK